MTLQKLWTITIINHGNLRTISYESSRTQMVSIHSKADQSSPNTPQGGVLQLGETECQKQEAIQLSNTG